MPKGKGEAPSKMVEGMKSHLDSNLMLARDTQRAQTKRCAPGPRDPIRE